MIIAIDGSSKRNGKPDCAAAGAAYCLETGKFACGYEYGSTNQRGEMLGCISALRMIEDYIEHTDEDVFMIVTDSEYIFNALYKDWPGSWATKGWKTANGDPVKNQDLWKQIHSSCERIRGKDAEILAYHIKGHLVSIGDVTARKLLLQDTTGKVLFEAASEKYEVRIGTHAEMFDKAIDLFKRNNGAMVDEVTFKRLVLCNTVADYAAVNYLADQEERRLNES